MRSIILIALFAGAVAYTTECTSHVCPNGCDCSCTATCTYPPTASPTSAPTGTPGRCCGKDENTGENFCKITDQVECEGETRRAAKAPANFVDTLNRRGGESLGGTWTASKYCNVADPCETGVPVSVGGTNFTLNLDKSGLGPNAGISLTPLTEASLDGVQTPKLPGDVLLAFEVSRFEGSADVPSGFLSKGNYIAVNLNPSDPEIEDAGAVQVFRWDDDELVWVDIQDECKDYLMSTDFSLDTSTDPNTLTVYLCHTSTFIMTASTDSHDDKKTKKGKKDKVPTVGKDAKSGKKDGAKAGAKGGKKVGIAVGAAVGGVAVLAGAAIAVIKCRNGKKTTKKTKKAGKARETAEVSAPVGMSV